MKRFISIVLFSLIASFTFAQKDNDIVLNVAGEDISKKTFVEMYQRNNPNPEKKIIRKDLDEYLDLYINFKLKLAEAKKLGLDTLPEYVQEVSTYRKQLIEPYLNDKTVTEELVNEAYERTKEIIRASHILIMIPTNATPKDTLEAYNKALDLRKRILKGENFGDLAVQYSEDPSVKDQNTNEGQNKMKGNRGDLGYFTSFSMIYPFETACYNLKVNEISMPIRSQRGYHIIQLTDRKPAPYSTATIAHIWVNFDNHSSPQECKNIVDRAYADIQNNVPFDTIVAKYSDDKYSARSQGVLAGQRVVNMPVEYTDMIIKTPLKEFTKPFETRYGWHILKPVSLVPVQSLEVQRKDIEQRIARDVRSYRTIEEFIKKSKEEYSFKEDLTKLDAVSGIITDSIFSAKWDVPENFIGGEVIFTIGDYSFTQKDLAEEIESMQQEQTPEYIPTYVHKLYKKIANEKVITYADSKLEQKHPELKLTVDEFRDGILIFTITDKFIWNKSIVDTIGLSKFFENNNSKYQWKERADATIFSFGKDIDFVKAKKVIEKGFKKKKSNQEIQNLLAKNFKVKSDTSKYFDYKWNRFEKRDNRVVDKTNWKVGVSDIIEFDNDKKKYIVITHAILSPSLKTLGEAKGIATSDYQEYLEDEWIKKLRKDYTYKVYDDVFNSIIN